MEINHLRYEPLAEYSAVFGHKMDDDTLKDMLSRIGCQKAISILSRFASLHIAVCHQIQDAVRLDWQLRVLHSMQIREAGGDWLQYNQFGAMMCTQSILNLQKWVLTYCPVEDELSPITLPDLMLIMNALLTINDMLPSADVEGHETEYLYLTLYYNTHKVIKDQIARSFYVFSTLAKQHIETTEFLRRYELKRRFSMENRLAVIFNSLACIIPQFTIEDMVANRLYVQAEGFNAKGLAPEYDQIIKSIRCDYEKAKESNSKVLENIWNFEPFYRTPFVKIGNVQFAYSETVLVYQIWEGLYWDVRFTFKEDGETFMCNFGKPFEHYIQEITCAAVADFKDNVHFQNEFLYVYKGDNKASTDCYIRIGKTLVAVEAKAKSPHSDTLKGVSRAAIDTEVNELMIDPVAQVLDRFEEIYSRDNNIKGETAAFFEDVDQIIILSVCMEKVQPIGELLYSFDAKIKEKLRDKIVETRVVAYHNVSVEDYEVICNLIETCPDELSTILTSWFADQRKDIRSAVVLANFLSSCGKRYICSKRVTYLFNESIREISTKTFGEDILPPGFDM